MNSQNQNNLNSQQNIQPPQATNPPVDQATQPQRQPPQTQQNVNPQPQNQNLQAKNAINPNSTQNHLKIAEIRDGIVIMEDGSFRSVVMAKSINFDLMSPNEREAVEQSYQSFLNSLYFPVQIFVRSQKIDMALYIDKLNKIRKEHDNMLLSLLMEDYIAFIDDLASQTNIMDKEFYVIVPYTPNSDDGKKNLATDSKNMIGGLASIFSNTQTHVFIDEKKLEDAKTELRNRVQSVLGGLDQCGVKSIPLDTQELIELYYDAYNPDTATRQRIRDFTDLSAPLVTKGQGQAPQPNLDKELES